MKKTWKSLLVVSAMTSMLFAFAACNDEEVATDITPTIAEENVTPEATVEPTVEPTATPEPTPTEVPSDEPVIVHNVDVEKKRDTLYFSSRGGAAAFWGTIGKDSDGSVQVTSRSATWHGVSLSFTDATYTAHDVVGKEVFVSFDVYQESGAPMNISCTLEAKKPDGSNSWPERISTDDVPSGEWVHIEGIIPVYANAASPILCFESADNATSDFYLDNVLVSYVPSSYVEPDPEFDPVAKIPFENVSLDFEDGTTGVFGARGDATPTVVDGALYVTGRTSSWHGAQADFTAYDLAGKTLTVTFKAKHDEAAPISIKATLSESDGSETTYASIAGSDEEPIAAGEWVELSGSVTVLDTTVAPILYFEATETASFYIDDVTVTVE